MPEDRRPGLSDVVRGLQERLGGNLEKTRIQLRNEVEWLARKRVAAYDKSIAEELPERVKDVERVIVPWWNQFNREGRYGEVMAALLLEHEKARAKHDGGYMGALMGEYGTGGEARVHRYTLTKPFPHKTPWAEIQELERAKAEGDEPFKALVDTVVISPNKRARGGAYPVGMGWLASPSSPINAKHILEVPYSGFEENKTWFAVGLNDAMTADGIFPVHKHYEYTWGCGESMPLDLTQDPVEIVRRVGPDPIEGFTRQIRTGEVAEILGKRSEWDANVPWEPRPQREREDEPPLDFTVTQGDGFRVAHVFFDEPSYRPERRTAKSARIIFVPDPSKQR